MSPAVDSSAGEAPVPTDESTVVDPVPSGDIQPEKVTQSSHQPSVVEDVGEVQTSPLKEANLNTTVEDGIDYNDDFGPPPLPHIIPKGPISRPVVGGPRSGVNRPKPK